MFFHPLPSSPYVNGSTLCFRLMAYAHRLMLPLLTALEWTWFCMLHCLVRWLQWWRIKQRKDFIKIGTLHTCFSLLPLRFMGVHINKLTFFSIIVWVTKGFKGLLLVVLRVFYKWKVLVALQRMHAIPISRRTIIVVEGSFKLG